MIKLLHISDLKKNIPLITTKDESVQILNAKQFIQQRTQLLKFISTQKHNDKEMKINSGEWTY